MDRPRGRTPGIALALSGGGFRATLFHLGALWRLNELGLLARLRIVTSVSGGSIAAAMLGHRWGALRFDGRGVAADFEPAVVAPLRAFCGRTHDAGAPFDADPTPWSNWFSTTRRAFNVAIEQARSLRRRWLVREYRAGRLEGAYWSIGTRIDGYGLPDALARDGEATAALARLRTRLDAFSSGEQVRLVNWGYALCDAAVRRRLPELAAAAGRLPDPPPPAG
jgi:hypothetical protein